MGMFEDLLGQFGNIDDLAQKLGLPADAEQALAAQIQQGGNPIETITKLAAEHGISMDMIQGMLSGEGNPLDNLSGIAKNLFGS